MTCLTSVFQIYAGKKILGNNSFVQHNFIVTKRLSLVNFNTFSANCDIQVVKIPSATV